MGVLKPEVPRPAVQGCRPDGFPIHVGFLSFPCLVHAPYLNPLRSVSETLQWEPDWFGMPGEQGRR